MNILDEERIKSIGIGHQNLFIELKSGKIIKVPLEYTKKLANAKVLDLVDYKLIGDGIGIHFPVIDEDISLKGIIEDFLST